MATAGALQMALLAYQMSENENNKTQAKQQRKEDLLRAQQWRDEDYRRQYAQEKKQDQQQYQQDFIQRSGNLNQIRNQVHEMQTGLPALGANLRNL